MLSSDFEDISFIKIINKFEKLGGKMTGIIIILNHVFIVGSFFTMNKNFLENFSKKKVPEIY